MNAIDWKYYAMLAATIAGFTIPWWLSHQDTASLSIKIISQTALQPDGANEVAGLKISFEGQELISPYLTVLEISNNGTQPISANEFESPLEIRTLDDVKIVRAHVSRTLPNDLQPKIELSEGVVKLQPLLLNANDSITAYFVTSGDKPNFSHRGRIAGVSSINLEDNTRSAKTTAHIWIKITIAFALQIAYFIAARGVTSKFNLQIRRRSSLFIALSSAFGCGILIASLKKEIDLSNMTLVAIIMAATLISIILASFINQNSKRSPVNY